MKYPLDKKDKIKKIASIIEYLQKKQNQSRLFFWTI